MCGINGIVSTELSPQAISKRLGQMNEILIHRGPDDTSHTLYSIWGRSIGVGFVRLSILDLETGMQPLHCDRDDTSIICNGQIYNYLELKEIVKSEPFISKGDIEVALHLYRTKGVDFLSFLNGMYAGAILDLKKNRLLLFRDRFGIKPLYYFSDNTTFLFSSEIKPMLHGFGIPPEMNAKALAGYFTYRYVPGSETLFKGIHRVPPGTYLDYDLVSGEFEIKKYWDYRFGNVNEQLSIEDASEEFIKLFADAVNIRLRSDVEVGTLISGGIDSSAVSSQAALFQPTIRLFSIAFNETKYNELPDVKRFMNDHPDRFRAARHYFQNCGKDDLVRLPDIVKSLEEPVSLGTILPTDMVCEMASQKLKVVLTGEGADEIFAGYRKFMIERAASQFQVLNSTKQKELLHVFPELNHYLLNRKRDPGERYIQNEALYNSDEIRRLTGQHQATMQFSENSLPFISGDEDPVNQMIAYETCFRLPNYVILRLDRLSMRHSLEARTPLLDYRLAEFAATLPVQFKTNLEAVREKFICSDAYLKYHILDRKTASRRKQPFTIPMADWLSDPTTLPDFIQDILYGKIIHRQGMLDPESVHSLTGKVNARDVGPDTLVSAADQIFAVIIFTIWYEEFFS